MAACFSSLALANPTNPTVVHGTAAFQQAGGVLNVTNSHNAIINWGSFSIGVNELTRFIQPSALSAVLNRVTGQDPSAILGALQSNGRVFLLNPNGIMFGAGAQINVAGLVASTLNMSNEDFLSGRMRFTDGAGAGSVINQGAINASGGPVYLVGNAVTNQGIITSPQGEIVLAAGNSVELVNPGTPNLRVEIQAGNNEARNLGSIVADAGRIGIYAGLVKQSGVINADSVVAEGGRILLKSTKRTDIEAGSVTTARGTNGGEILALSGMTDGVVQVSGTLNASSNAANAPGNGGFIETSAATVNVAGSASIAAEARNGGSRGRWLIDPADFTIAVTGGNTTGAAISSALNGASGGTEIDIQSTSGGSIHVNDSIAWSSAADLRLFAYGGDINVNQSIANNDAGSVKLYAGWDGASMSAPVVSGTGAINLNAAVSVGGSAHLVAGGNITQNIGGDMMAAQLLAKSVNGTVNLTQNGNNIGTVAGSASGDFHLKNAGALTVASVGGVNGITSGSGLISLIASGGSLGQTSAGVLTAPELLAISTNSSVNLTAASNAIGTVAGRSAGQFALKNVGNLAVGSVDGTDGIIVNGSNPGLHATVNLDVTGTLTVNQYVKSLGASSGLGLAGGNATLTLASTGAMTVNAEVLAEAGDGGEGMAGGNAALTLTSGGGLTVNATVSSLGGHGGETYYSGVPAGLGGTATVTLNNNSSGASVLVGSIGSIGATGGGGGDSYESSSAAGRGGDATVSINSAGGYLQQGYIDVTGGHGGEREDNPAGRGGDATVMIAALGASGLQISSGSTISSTGGEGGNAVYSFGGGSLVNGAGGDALVQLTSTGNMNINGSIYSTGGIVSSFGGDSSGNSGNAVIRLTSTGGSLSLANAYVRADGGEGWRSPSAGGALVELKSAGNLLVNGGSVLANGGISSEAGNGGNAMIKLQSTGGTVSLTGYPTITASGGSGDFYSAGGNGGDGVVQIEAAGDILLNTASINANGGAGSDASNGGGSLVLMSAGGNVSMTGFSGVAANGGDAGGYGAGAAGGGAGITILAGGTVLIDGSEGFAWGGDGNANNGGSAAVNIVGGAVTLANNAIVAANQGIGSISNGSSSALLAAVGNVTIDDASLSTGGFAGLFGSGVSLNNGASVYGSTGVGATITGSLALNNGSTLSGGSGNASITTSGDVLVNSDSRILGNPDVILRVGGSVRMNSGGTIEAGSVETINLTFLLNNGNSFFVNGLKDVVYDAATGTGFIANGQPAQLGDSLKVSYLGSNVVTTLKIPSETLIVALNSATKPPDEQKKSTDPANEKDGGDGKDGKEKKKSLPICGK